MGPEHNPYKEWLGKLAFFTLDMYFWNSSCSALFNQVFCVWWFGESRVVEGSVQIFDQFFLSVTVQGCILNSLFNFSFISLPLSLSLFNGEKY